jgi:hypothetical protein
MNFKELRNAGRNAVEHRLRLGKGERRCLPLSLRLFDQLQGRPDLILRIREHWLSRSEADERRIVAPVRSENHAVREHHASLGDRRHQVCSNRTTLPTTEELSRSMLRTTVPSAFAGENFQASLFNERGEIPLESADRDVEAGSEVLIASHTPST